MPLRTGRVVQANASRRGGESDVAAAVLDAAFDPIVAVDLDGMIRFANRAVEGVFGWSVAELLGRRLSVLMPEWVPESAPETAEERRPAASVGGAGARVPGSAAPLVPGIQRLEGQHRNGTTFRCELAVSPARSPGPDGAWLVCVVRDLTGRSNPDLSAMRSRRINDGAALARLQEASTRLVPREDGLCLMGHILDAAIAIDSARSGALQLCDSTTGIYSVQSRCIESTEVVDFFARPDFGRHPLGQALERGERVIVADVLKSSLLRDPEERGAFASAGIRALHCTPLVGRGGQFLGVLSTHHGAPRRPREQHLRLMDILARQLSDFIERARAEHELRRSEARLRATLDSAIDAIVTIDGRGIVQSVNLATTRIFGYGESELVGQNVKLLMPSPWREQHDAYIDRYRRTGEKRIIGTGREVEGRRKDGSRFPADLSVAEVEPGSLFTGIVRDITERKADEARVRQADRMASIGTLAAGLGHDMNNVLLPVRARLNALRAAAADPRRAPTDGEHLDEIAHSVSYLQQLADGLHFLAMDPDQEQESAVERPTDLAAWWAQTGLLISKAVPKHVDVASDIPSNLSPVRVGTASLTQAVLNLVVNAGEAIPVDGKRRGRVTVWAKVAPAADGKDRARRLDNGPPVVLGVTDDGVGMSEEVRRRAFELFFTTKPRGLGTGLGLALVRRVVERAGGSVSIDSIPGEGTTVAMTLPTAARSATRGLAAPKACVGLRDARAAALVRQLLASLGCTLSEGGRVAGAAIRVADVGAMADGALLAWRRRHPSAGLVLVGQAKGSDAAAATALRAEMVEDPNDFVAIRSALSRAVAAVHPSTTQSQR